MNRHVLAVDPGKVSGLAYWVDGELVRTHEEKFTETCNLMRAYIKPDVDVVIEKFVINTMTAKMSQAPWSLEAIGVARYLSGDQLTFQRPSEAKKAVPNTTLMKLGWWHPGGAGHALDAIRHLIYYLMVQREPQLLARLDELNL